MGAEVRTNIMPQEKIPWDNAELSEAFSPESINLDKIINLCKEKNIPILFICMPCNVNAGVFASLNHFDGYMEENDIPYLNIAKDENFLNYRVDFSDESHVNVAGGLKLTDYIGAYFVENFSVCKYDKETEDRWNAVLSEYKNEKDGLIISAGSSAETLMMLTYADDDYTVEIEGDETAFDRYMVREFFADIEPDTGEKFHISIYRKKDMELLAEFIED